MATKDTKGKSAAKGMSNPAFMEKAKGKMPGKGKPMAPPMGKGKGGKAPPFMKGK